MTKKFTYCGICLAACGMEVEVENNQIVSLRGDSQHPLSRGFLCKKGTACRDMTTDPLRILHPYKREGSDWRRISWDEAYGEISQKLGEIISKYGPNSVGMYFGAGTATSSVKPVVAGAFLEELGSDRMYNVLTLEFTNRYLVLEAMYGHQSMVTQPDLEQTQCLLVFGSNPLVSLDHPGIVPSLKAFKKRGAKLIVVDPRKTETARHGRYSRRRDTGHRPLHASRNVFTHIRERPARSAVPARALRQPRGSPGSGEADPGGGREDLRCACGQDPANRRRVREGRVGLCRRQARHTHVSKLHGDLLADRGAQRGHGQRRQAGRPHLQSRRNRPHQDHGCSRGTKGPSSRRSGTTPTSWAHIPHRCWRGR